MEKAHSLLGSGSLATWGQIREDVLMRAVVGTKRGGLSATRIAA